jgi:hypothetical protein
MVLNFEILKRFKFIPIFIVLAKGVKFYALLNGQSTASG